jgi:hypothetical protein
MHGSNRAQIYVREIKNNKLPEINARSFAGFTSKAVVLAATFACGMLAQSETADAVPSFARQTGYYCSTCHTAQPELTPFGRQFKLNGYTSGGTRCGDASKILGNADPNSQEWSGANFAGWVMPAFQHTGKKLTPDATPSGYPSNDIADPLADASIFFAGQIYCNLGTFSQFSYNRAPNVIFLDNTELRYTGQSKVGGNDVVWGVLGNNNPTMQDVWNTAPAWLFPWVPQDVAPAPTTTTMVEGAFGQRAGGAGAYLWVNNMFYAELSAYKAFDRNALKATGSDPTDGTPTFKNLAPYWRVAVEKTWNENSLMFGTFGMAAEVQPTVGGGNSSLLYGAATDKYTDAGIDAQYQYIGPLHAFTTRAYYIWEHQKLDATYGGGDAARLNQDLESWNVSASYIYDRHISLTGALFGIKGKPDATYYGGFSTTGRPDSNGYSVDLAYIPYPYGGPDLWPWLNARIGLLYTHWDKFDGASNNYAGDGRNARDNDTTFLYAWIDF